MTFASIHRALRRATLALLATTSLLPSLLTAQATDSAKRPVTAAASRPATDSATRAVERRRADTASRRIEKVIRVRIDTDESTRARVDSQEAQVKWGEGQVAPGDTIQGDLVNLFGDVEVRGVVLGSAVALFGDLTIHENAVVDGDAVSLMGDLTLLDGSVVRHDAVAVSGQVRVDGGRVEGSIVSGSGKSGSWRIDEENEGRVEPQEPRSRWESLLGVLIAAAMLSVFGIVAAAALPARLDTIVRRLEAGVGRAFLAGLFLELGFVPILLLLLLSLVLTVVGILLIPFAVVALPALYLVLGLLGWFATAALVGRGVTGDHTDERRSLMRAVSVGTGILLLPFALAAALPDFAGWLVALAVSITWVAVTAGFGAAVLSRAGKPRAAAPSFWSPTPPTPPAPPAPPATID